MTDKEKIRLKKQVTRVLFNYKMFYELFINS